MEQEPKVFDISKLDDHQLGQMEYVLKSTAYTDVFKPFFEACRDDYVHYLCLRDPVQRNKMGGTEYLRAGKNNMEELLNFFEKIVAEAQDERVLRARGAVGEEDLYRDAVSRGEFRGGSKQTVPDYAPDEEF